MVTLSLLGYPEGSVGRLMLPDYVYVRIHIHSLAALICLHCLQDNQAKKVLPYKTA